MTRVIITTVSFVIAAFILAACSSNSMPETNPEPAYSAAASEMYLGASLAPYASPNEPVWSPGKAAPNSVPTPPGIAEEVEEDEEEEEEDPVVEKCHTTAEACFSSESEEIECLTALATCLNATTATEVGACIQAEVDCLNSGVDAALCGNQADTCLEDLE
jgi:hypothetical protein